MGRLFSKKSGMLERFRDALSAQCKVPAGSGVLLAVSGGPDSTAMLYLFHGAKQTLGLHLEAAHLHHRIRGLQADQDAEFVQKTCGSLHVPCRVLHFDVPRFARSKKVGMEEAGRRIRRHLFLRLAKARKLDFIAFAHTADDQAETVFLNVIRGSGPRGLAGISPSRGKVIHPLLGFAKREILGFLEANGLEHRVDATNQDRQYLRNKIRLDVFPFLQKQFCEDLKKNLNRAAEIFRDEDSWVESLIDPYFQERFRPLDRDVYELTISLSEKLPQALARRLIRRFLETSLGSLEGIGLLQVEQMLDLLRRQTGKRFEFSDFVVERTPGGLAVSSKLRGWGGEVEVEIPGQTMVVPLHLRLESVVSGWNIGDRSLWDQSPDQSPFRRDEAFLDCEKVELPVRVRTRRDGDTLSVIGLDSHVKKLQDYFVDRKVPRLLRDRIPLLTCPRGILWVGGYDVDERFKVTPVTKKVLHLKLVHE